MSIVDSCRLIRGYLQGEYYQSFREQQAIGHRMRIDYGSGTVEEIDLPEDFGRNQFEAIALTNKLLAYEARTGIFPKTERIPYNRRIATLTNAVEIGSKAVATGLVAASLLAGFLDRYRLTLAARVDGIEKAISALNDITKPCIDRLPTALQNVEKAESLVSQIQAAIKTASEATQALLLNNRLPQATSALTDAETAKRGLEVCANLMDDFKSLLQPMVEANKEMAGKGMLTKLRVLLSHGDMKTVSEAWKDYSIGKQSLSFLINAASGLLVGYTVKDASYSVCRNILNLSERHSRIAGYAFGITAGICTMASGQGVVQVAQYTLTAVATNYAAKGIGKGIQMIRRLTG